METTRKAIQEKINTLKPELKLIERIAELMAENARLIEENQKIRDRINQRLSTNKKEG